MGGKMLGKVKVANNQGIPTKFWPTSIRSPKSCSLRLSISGSGQLRVARSSRRPSCSQEDRFGNS